MAAGRPPDPTALAKLKGADKHDPQRYRGRAKEPKPRIGIGECPARLSDTTRAIWDELKDDMAPGVLTRQDRRMFAVLCRLFAEYDADPDMSGTKLGQLNSIAGQFGLTPSMRTKVRVTDDEQDAPQNPFAQFTAH